jgi:hypothetical protein
VPPSKRLAPLGAALLGAIVVILVVAAALFGYHRSPKVGTYEQRGPLASDVASVLPTYENCGATPQFEPHLVQTCGEPCNAGMHDIRWTMWTKTRAQGVGTFATNLHQSDCTTQGIPSPGTPHPGITIVLRQPETVTFCAMNSHGAFVVRTQVVFTIANVLPSLDLLRPGCPARRHLAR